MSHDNDPFSAKPPSVLDLSAVHDSNRPATDAIKGVGHHSALDFSGVHASIKSATDAMKGIGGLSEAARIASGSLGADSAFTKLARQIADQQHAIASLRPHIPAMPERVAMPDRFSIPEVRMPPNPLHETNKRLASIERRFEQMESIALNGAEIATGLQASAAVFLTKFEKASQDNDRTSSRAIWIGTMAILIAVITPIAQVFYTEMWRAPADSASMQAAITDMKGEIKALQTTQKTAADELAKVLSAGNSESTAALRDIRNLLAAQQKPATLPLPAKP